MEFLLDYASFLLKAATITVAIVVIVSAILATGMRKQQRGTKFGHLEVRHVNETYETMRSTLEMVTLPPAEAKKVQKALKSRHSKKSSKKKSGESQETGATDEADGNEESEELLESVQEGGDEKKTVFVVEFEGDLEASRTANLKHEISAVLTFAKPNDEVVVRVESAGGLVHSYGYAASQLLRVKNAGLNLVVCVDKVAASGGYMLAVVADRILAAPFAVVGSIGVAAELPNLNRLLKKYDVDYEVFTAGDFKRTVSVFGENTDTGREKFLEEIEDTHGLFKDFVIQHRSQVDLDVVSTGESWYGERALAIQLVDELQTSDEYIMNVAKDSEVYAVMWTMPKKPLAEVLASSAEGATRLWNQFMRRFK